MTCSTKSQYIISKDLTFSKKNADCNTFDLKPLLELLHVNNDVNVQVKLFTTLSAYIMTNEESRDLIITYNSLYDKICKILCNCSPRATTVTFNFLSALLFANDKDNNKRKNLIEYAKNTIRSSGCLAAMCDMFTSCMMHQDVWRSLCRCLAEVCCGVEANQSYCTHLVPMCIQKCSQQNIEVFSVLQSLLQNHTKNVNLFLECNGITLFRREFLQHDDCLQVLNTLVQSSTEAARLINESHVSQHMHDFLSMYGPDTQLGRWATIILYYISEAKGPPVDSDRNKDVHKPIDNIVNINRNDQCTADTTKLLQNVINEIIHCGDPGDMKYLRGLIQPLINSKNINNNIEQFYNPNHQDKTELLASNQNIMKHSFLSRNSDNNAILNGSKQVDNIQNSTFSFLQNHKGSLNVTKYCNTADNTTECLQRATYTNDIFSMMSINRDEYSSTIRCKTPKMHNFCPKFVSTPKKDYKTENNKLKIELSRNSTRKPIKHSMRKREAKRSATKYIPRCQQQCKVDKDNKHRSISGWFFDTINESCTTLVKTVKNIFKPKISVDETKTQSLFSIANKNSSFCSFSFTNYMRKRDAILKKECTRKSRVFLEDISVEMLNSCHTCNDTAALKRKLANDEYLKQTVRKLKLGINLYGCDFKKISKHLWPQQTYMTPAVLYHLYRKLIIK